MKIRFINTKEVVDVDISTCTTVRDILHALSVSTGHEESAIYMIFRGKQMKAEEPLSTYNIVEESKIVAVYKKPSTPAAAPTTPAQKPQNPISTEPAPVVPQNTTPAPKPTVQEAPQTPESSTVSKPTSEDVAHVKQVLSSPSFHNLLVACRHLPFHVTEVMLLLEHTDQRAYDIICKDKSILIDAIMAIPEMEVPRTSQPAPSGLSRQDEDNIANLMSLGFSRQDCIAAYIACDRNVDAAANFLFS
ncbi:hypothetical protein WA577_007166, partial [Blastocystis sp. JDR]